MKRLEEAARVLKDGPSQDTLRAQRASVVARARPSRTRWAVVGFVLAMALTGISWKLTRPIVTPVTFGILTQGQLRLPDGSVLSVDADSVARLSRFDDASVEVQLERGALTAWVQKGTGRTWRYVAGPWTVRVLGTTLRIVHDPSSRRIEVSVEEGVVELDGPGGSTLIRAGEIVRRNDAAPEVVSKHLEPPGVKQEAPSPKPNHRSPPVAREPESIVVTPELTAADPAPHVPTWQELLESGQRKAALDRWEAYVQPAGISDSQLLRLADAARLEHRMPTARALLEEIESRHGSGAAEAAYLLGRFEVEAHALEAAQLRFSTSVMQQPKGPFAEQSRGRLIEVLLELERTSAARSAARDYLQHHPRGAWSGLASRVMGDAGW